MSLLFIALDTMFRGVILVAIYFGGRYLIREARQGFPSLNPDTNWEIEHDQCDDLSCGKCIACESYEAYLEGELKKYCGCDRHFNCYCEFYEDYK